MNLNGYQRDSMKKLTLLIPTEDLVAIQSACYKLMLHCTLLPNDAPSGTDYVEVTASDKNILTHVDAFQLGVLYQACRLPKENVKKILTKGW